jgi:PAS domain S-box-containing protein
MGETGGVMGEEKQVSKRGGGPGAGRRTTVGSDRRRGDPAEGSGEISEARNRYADLYEFAPVGYLTLNSEGLIKEINLTGAGMLGMERSALIGKRLWSFVSPESRDSLHLCLIRLFETKGVERCDLAVLKSDGVLFHALLEARRAVHDEEQKGELWWCVMTDITERKRAEESLRAAHHLNRSLFEASIDPFAAVDLKGRIVDVNPACERITGYSREEMTGRHCAGFFADSKKALAGFKQALQAGAVRDYPLEIRRKDGSVTPILYNGVVYRDEAGKEAGVFVTARDMDAHRRVEEERTRLATVVEQADESVIITDRDWRIQYVNPAFERVTGYTREEVAGRHITFIGSVKQGDMFYRGIRDILKSGRTWAGRGTAGRKDGSTYTMEASMSSIRNDGGTVVGYAAVGRDITEQLKLEEQVRHGQKMEAVGTLAGGIAHDFNNILAGILGFTEMAIDDTPEDSTVVKNLRYVLKGALRGRDLVKQILAFSRQGAREKRPLFITPLIKETVKLLRASLPSTVEINLRINAESDMVLADPSQIQQVLVNLCTNAAQAMDESGGTLEIGLADLEVRPGGLPDPEVQPGQYLQLVVKDTGVGMPPEVLARVFEPFYTTRRATQGTGLGLAVVFGIVKGLGGAILVESTPGCGSTFRVLLPRGSTGPESLRPVQPGTLMGEERILFVDDEETLVLWAKSALERLGYKVTAVTDSMEAFESFAADPAGFDLVITDQTMPKMTGRRLAEKLLDIRPDVPIILCTGYSENISPGTGQEERIRECLLKPVSKRELAEAIRRAMEGAGEL